jgi:hypothetical protein
MRYKIKIQNENSDLKLQSKNNQNYFLFFNGRISISGGDFVFAEKAKNKIYAELQLQTEQISNLKDNVQVQNDHLNDLNNTKTNSSKSLRMI